MTTVQTSDCIEESVQLEEEFSQLYHEPTARYTYLAQRQHGNPSYLPRNLSYRIRSQYLNKKNGVPSKLAHSQQINRKRALEAIESAHTLSAEKLPIQKAFFQEKNRPGISTNTKAKIGNNQTKTKEKNLSIEFQLLMDNKEDVEITEVNDISIDTNSMLPSKVLLYERHPGVKSKNLSFALLEICKTFVRRHNMKSGSIRFSSKIPLVNQMYTIVIQVFEWEDVTNDEYFGTFIPENHLVDLTAPEQQSFLNGNAQNHMLSYSEEDLRVRNQIQRWYSTSNAVVSTSLLEEQVLNGENYSEVPPKWSSILELSKKHYNKTKSHFKVELKSLPISIQNNEKKLILHGQIEWHLSSTSCNDITIEPQNTISSSNIVFHFLYHQLLRRNTELRSTFSCPWCSVYTGSLDGLINHLVCCHADFQYHVLIDRLGTANIYILPLTSKHTSKIFLECRQDYFYYRKCPMKNSSMSSLNEQIVPQSSDSIKPIQYNECIDENEEDMSKPFIVNSRQYFHSRTGSVVLRDEMNYDSDDDVDEEWILQQSEKLLDEFEDVSLEEKEFMKLWNRHVHAYKIMADLDVPNACVAFVEQFWDSLKKKGLRYNLLLHLFNLWDYCLLNENHVVQCMACYDNYSDPPLSK